MESSGEVEKREQWRGWRGGKSEGSRGVKERGQRRVIRVREGSREVEERGQWEGRSTGGGKQQQRQNERIKQHKNTNPAMGRLEGGCLPSRRGVA